MFNIAVIGLGNHSQKSHLPILDKLKKENLVCFKYCCDLFEDLAERTKKSFGFEFGTTNYNQVLDDKTIDAVYVFGTAKLHYNVAKEALEKGKHVFVEKPPTENHTQAKELVKLSQETSKKVFVGFNRRFYETLGLLEQEIGKNYKQIEAFFHTPFLNLKAKYGTQSWFEANSVHALDLLIYLNQNQRPSEVYFFKNGVGVNGEDNYLVILKWASNNMAVLSSNNQTGKNYEEYRIQTDNIFVSFDRANISFDFINGSNKKLKAKNPSTKNEYSFEAEHRNFLNCIKNQEPGRSLLEDVLPTIEVVDFILANRQGRL